ncbi:VPA1262 family N-terminal domain-containing protein [Burkholderia sp. KJ006]|uniref:VPA1262 family N-terminal domain-containing protein n=1 Tax=Burkholderia sp. KJ006 TaxID=416344 RepID=UPI0011D2409A|nr:VPA1262 family N-terminal domain-containing protein [Burkholderia sp. KJ006]
MKMDVIQRQDNINKAVISLRKLLEIGLLGQYTWFEAIEVIAFGNVDSAGNRPTRNVFSIYVAEHGEMPSTSRSIFLDKKSKKLKGFDGWSFRVTKRPVGISELLESLECYGRIGTWTPPGQPPLEVGNLVARPAAFCPPDSHTDVPLNAVLKNNFWSGSYVIELKDDEKSTLRDLARKDAAFGELSEWLMTMLPLNLARVPDRIGDVLFQIPANALVVNFRRRPGKPVELRLAWNPEIKARPVLAEYRVEQDGLISCFSRFDLQEGAWAFDIPETSGDLQMSVWDIENNLLLAATATLQVHGGKWRFESHTSSGVAEPRRFKAIGPGGDAEIHEIALMEPSGGWRHHRQPRRPEDVDWRARRELKARMNQLVVSRKFLQYGHDSARQQDERRRALEDLRVLIRSVSHGAVYLWDPYLSANDVLNTLAFCTDAGTELWGLTSSKPSKMRQCDTNDDVDDIDSADAADATDREQWIETQRNTLDDAFDGPPCMKLEFRMSWGIQGSFHDRFLIFPGLGRGRTRVWSLGASINHIGAQHCIVQEVSYPEPVLEAFQGFWEQSNRPEHLIWKYS